MRRVRATWPLSESESRAARSLGAAGLCALAMLFCGIVHRFGTADARLIAAIAMPGFTFGWAAYLVVFWRRMHLTAIKVEVINNKQAA